MRVRDPPGPLRRLGVGKGLFERIDEMNAITYRVVRHEDGWAFEANGMHSKGFRTREAARKAAKLAAGEHATVETTPMSYEKPTWQDDSG
jgi:hypothetical protein